MKMAYMFIWYLIFLYMYAHSILFNHRKKYPWIISRDSYSFLAKIQLKIERYSLVLRALIIKNLTLKSILTFLLSYSFQKNKIYLVFFIINTISMNKQIINNKIPRFKITLKKQGNYVG